VVRWQKARDRDGNVIDRCAVSDKGYKVARFTLAGKELYRASFQGEFLHMPVTDKAEAVAVCNNHHSIMG
jgi:hypothetical protein